jgi:hypothetical protein
MDDKMKLDLACNALRRIALNISGDTVPKVVAGDCLDVLVRTPSTKAAPAGIVTQEFMSQLFCVVVVDISSQKAVGVDFCKDLEELQRRAAMSLRDCGDDCIVLTYPDSGTSMTEALLDAFGTDALAR